MSDFKIGDTVTNSLNYFGNVVQFERKFRTDWVVVQWEGNAYTVREYPHALTVCPVRPARVTPYQH